LDQYCVKNHSRITRAASEQFEESSPKPRAATECRMY